MDLYKIDNANNDRSSIVCLSSCSTITSGSSYSDKRITVSKKSILSGKNGTAKRKIECYLRAVQPKTNVQQRISEIEAKENCRKMKTVTTKMGAIGVKSPRSITGASRNLQPAAKKLSSNVQKVTSDLFNVLDNSSASTANRGTVAPVRTENLFGKSSLVATTSSVRTGNVFGKSSMVAITASVRTENLLGKPSLVSAAASVRTENLEPVTNVAAVCGNNRKLVTKKHSRSSWKSKNSKNSTEDEYALLHNSRLSLSSRITVRTNLESVANVPVDRGTTIVSGTDKIHGRCDADDHDDDDDSRRGLERAKSRDQSRPVEVDGQADDEGGSFPDEGGSFPEDSAHRRTCSSKAGEFGSSSSYSVRTADAAYDGCTAMDDVRKWLATTSSQYSCNGSLMDCGSFSGGSSQQLAAARPPTLIRNNRRPVETATVHHASGDFAPARHAIRRPRRPVSPRANHVADNRAKLRRMVNVYADNGDMSAVRRSSGHVSSSFINRMRKHEETVRVNGIIVRKLLHVKSTFKSNPVYRQ